MKICSLLPSATEMACSIGLKDDLVAVSHECDFPAEVKRLPKLTKPMIEVGSLTGSQIDEAVKDRIAKGLPLYEIDLDLLAELNPDLVLTQDLCRVCAISSSDIHKEIRRLGIRTRVLTLDARGMRQVLEAILLLGEFTHRRDEAKELVQRLRAESERMIDRTVGIENRPRVLCLDWVDPPYVGGHWIPEMSYIAGAFDGLGVPGTPSRQVTWEEIADYGPEYLLVMPCGYNLSQATEEARKLMSKPQMMNSRAVENGMIFALDANALFSRPGPRLFNGLKIMGKIIHPSLFGDMTEEDQLYATKVEYDPSA